MLWKILGSNFIHMQFLDRTNIKCQNRPVLPPAQVFYFNCQALHTYYYLHPIPEGVAESPKRPHFNNITKRSTSNVTGG
jgi:hypothetical protein